jgi:Pvc16 N-terminal domain
MSNSLAIATVTASVTAIVQARIDRAVFNSRPLVAPGNPDDQTNLPGVVVHLYRVERNGYRDNEDLLTRSSDGGVRQKPRTALDLHYLLVCHGDDPWETQRLIAITAAALHAVPVLGRDLVGNVGGDYPAATGNDLDHAEECVRITPESLTLDELTRLWALYPVASFVPVLGYVAGPVIVEADDEAATVLPVAAFAVGARPLSAPRLDDVSGPDGPGAPIRATAAAPTLHLFGAGLAAQAGETLEVLVDGTVAGGVTVVSDRELTLPAPTQRPGSHTVRVLRRGAPLGSLSPTRPPTSSLPARFSVLPSLATVTATGIHTGTESDGTLDATLQPALASTDVVRLLLDSQTLDPPVSVVVPAGIAGAPTTISGSYTDVPIDRYRVTLEVNGVRSIPKLDAAGHYVLPVVSV